MANATQLSVSQFSIRRNCFSASPLPTYSSSFRSIHSATYKQTGKCWPLSMNAYERDPSRPVETIQTRTFPRVPASGIALLRLNSVISVLNSAPPDLGSGIIRLELTHSQRVLTLEKKVETFEQGQKGKHVAMCIRGPDKNYMNKLPSPGIKFYNFFASHIKCIGNLLLTSRKKILSLKNKTFCVWKINGDFKTQLWSNELACLFHHHLYVKNKRHKHINDLIKGLMSFISSFFCSIFPQWRPRKTCLWKFLHLDENTSFSSLKISSSMNEDSASVLKQTQHDYDPSQELVGIDVNLQRRNLVHRSPKQRSWFGPNGQYIRELPCPSCRGRGYTPCTGCGIESSRLDCSLCNGKGIITCTRCLGECVIWEESIDERPWERAHSISPLKVKEDDEVDSLEIKLGVRRKSKRVYKPPPPEVGLKISRSLRSLNAKTGLFSKHMKLLHRDPKLHAQRVAAIKKTKGTAAARRQASEAMKAFFCNPENRHKRSLAMKGVKFFCSNCRKEGHRRHYCPELIRDNLIDRQFRCRLCGQKGHNQRTCNKSRPSESEARVIILRRCRVCGENGHNSRTCSLGSAPSGFKSIDNSEKGLMDCKCSRSYSCSLCKRKGHNVRTCPNKRKEKFVD